MHQAISLQPEAMQAIVISAWVSGRPAVELQAEEFLMESPVFMNSALVKGLKSAVKQRFAEH